MHRSHAIRAATPLLAVVLATAACSGGGSKGAPAGPVLARVQVTPTAAFLAGVGQSRTLVAAPLDGAGAPFPGKATWTSSAPEQVSVDADGKITALRIGSAQIFAELNGIRSPPVLVVAARPAAGALLVADAQVVSVGAFEGLAAGDLPGVGAQYEVRLRGIGTPPAPGTIVLASEMSPIAGRVISTATEGDVLVVQLALASLPELMQEVNIDWEIDLSAYPAFTEVSAAPAAAAPGVVASPLFGGGLPLEPFKSLDCKGGVAPSYYNIDWSANPTGTGKLIVKLAALGGVVSDETRVEAVGTLTLDVQLKVTLQIGIKGSFSCRAQAERAIPVDGWLAAIIAPAVKFGFGLDGSAELVGLSTEVDLEGAIQFDYDEGVSCPTDGACSVIDVHDTQATLNKPALARQASTHDLKLVLDAYLYGLVALDAVFGGGAVGDLELFIGKYGLDQSADLAFEGDQAARQDYASSYQLKTKGGVGLGSGMTKLLNWARGKDSTPAGAAGLPVAPFDASPESVSFPASTRPAAVPDALAVQAASAGSIPSQSPTGLFHVDKTQIGLGQTVKLTVDLDAVHATYFPVGYNVEAIQIWRQKPNASDYVQEPTLTIPATDGQTHFEEVWKPTSTDDVGQNKLVALAQTKLGPVAIELVADTNQYVEVLCFPPASAGSLAAGVVPAAGASVCQDAWNATLSYDSGLAGGISLVHHDASVTFTRVSTFLTIAQYEAKGTLGVRFNPDGDCTYDLSPSAFVYPTGNPLDYSVLAVDYGQDPPVYQFGIQASVDFDVTATCSQGTILTHVQGYPFQIGDHGTFVTAGDTSFAGDDTQADGSRVVWSFAR